MGLHSAFEVALADENALGEVEAMIWQSLSAAAKSPRHAWNHGVFATARLVAGQIASLNSRTVILRCANPIERSVDCHTDARSQKVLDLSTTSAANWTFYDPKSKIQIRLNGSAEVINGAETDEAWRRTSLRSRSAYLSLETPGLPVDGDTPPPTADRSVGLEESERGRENFRIVRLSVAEIDWLYLRREGHLRIKIEYPESKSVQPTSKWLVP